MNNSINYYVQGHTGKGYINLIQSNLQYIERVILLQAKNPIVVTVVMQKLINKYKDKQIEIIKSIDSSQLIEGIIIRDQSLAILHEGIYDADDKNVTKITIPDSVDHVDLRKNTPNNEAYEMAYKHFAKGLEIHEQLEKIYIAQMDFTKADKIIERLLEQLFSRVQKQNRQSIVYERLFGTNTPDGIVNEVPSLIASLPQKIFIHGRAGTGKSYLMNKVGKKCLEFGIDVEVYRCSLDPNSIDMLIIRQLNVCIHDNTTPHVVKTEYDNKQIIDMYKETVDQTVELTEETKIRRLTEQYKKEMQTGLHYLKEQQIEYEQTIQRMKQSDFSHIIRKVLKNT